MKRIEWFYDKAGMYTEDQEKQYREAHRKTARIKKCLDIVNGFKHCSSILDVGCKSLGFVEMVGPQYTRKAQMDRYRPAFLSPDIPFHLILELNVYNTCPFDVVTCLEVMEHVEPKFRIPFAKELLSACSKHLVISIPYNWKTDSEIHPHTGYNESNIMEWFYPFYPDRFERTKNHLIAVLNKQKIEIEKQGPE